MRNIIVNAAAYALGATGRMAASRSLAGFGLGIAIQTIHVPSGKDTAPNLTIVMPI